MPEIKKHNPAEAEALDSREVAEMVEKRHTDLLRDIRGYIEHMENPKERAERKIASGEFFIPSSYPDANGQKRPNFLITKKGCEFVANKLTGEKGTKFTALYVTRFNLMEEREKAIQSGQQRKKVTEAQTTKRPALSSVNGALKIAIGSLQSAGVSPEYIALTVADAYRPYGINIPECCLPEGEKLFECEAIAKTLGVMSESGKPHKQAISTIIKLVGVGEGEVKMVPFSNGSYGNATAKYTISVVERVRNWLEGNGYPTKILGADGKQYSVRYALHGGA